MRFKSMWILCFSLLTGCGASSNFNQIWLGSEDGLDSLLLDCRILYDAGEFEEAEDKCDEALAMSPSSQAASILSGYVSLSRGGIDPYTLARKLINLNSPEDQADPNAGLNLSRSERVDSLEELFLLQPDSDPEAASSNSAADSLSKLGTLINLKPEDFEVLGSRLSQENGDFATNLFAGNEIFAANLVSPELRENVDVLRYMNQSVSKICPYVDLEVKIETDATGRHNCERKDNANGSAKAHFLWAFSHLTEALVFQSVLLYQGTSQNEDGTSSSNFQKAGNQLNNFSGSLTEFSDRVADMQVATDRVFDVTSEDSMLSRTLDALDTVTESFAKLSGLPTSITSSITSAVAKIRETGQSIGGENGNVKALKGQMTEKTAKVVAAKIAKATVNENGEVVTAADSEDVAKICKDFDTISQGVEESKVSKPEACR